MLGASASGIWKMTSRSHESMYTGLRPKYSDIGASISGPTANPRMYMDSPTVPTSEDTSKLDVSCSLPELYPPAQRHLFIACD